MWRVVVEEKTIFVDKKYGTNFVWNRILSDEEIDMLLKDPYCMFRNPKEDDLSYTSLTNIYKTTF